MPTESPLSEVKVLIVDDNDHVRKTVKLVLRAIGITRVGEAADGKQAISIMRSAMPDLLLADWEMSPMDGLQLTRYIRSSSESPNPFLPIIIMTGQADRQRVLAARDAGINDFVVKPLSGQMVQSRIVSTLEAPRSFVRGGQFFGPDRRRRTMPWDGIERRIASPELVPPREARVLSLQ